MLFTEAGPPACPVSQRRLGRERVVHEHCSDSSRRDALLEIWTLMHGPLPGTGGGKHAEARRGEATTRVAQTFSLLYRGFPILDFLFLNKARKVHDRPMNKGRNERFALFTPASEGTLLGNCYVWNCLEILIPRIGSRI